MTHSARKLQNRIEVAKKREGEWVTGNYTHTAILFKLAVDLVIVQFTIYNLQFKLLADAFNSKRLTISKVIHNQIHQVQRNARLIKKKTRTISR